MRRFIIATASALTLAGFAAPAVAAPNPSGMGQPSQDCSQTINQPPGFSSGGFANAEGVYANPGSQGGTSSGNGHVVSQYDVACYQVSQPH